MLNKCLSVANKHWFVANRCLSVVNGVREITNKCPSDVEKFVGDEVTSRFGTALLTSCPTIEFGQCARSSIPEDGLDFLDAFLDLVVGGFRI